MPSVHTNGVMYTARRCVASKLTSSQISNCSQSLFEMFHGSWVKSSDAAWFEMSLRIGRYAVGQLASADGAATVLELEAAATDELSWCCSSEDASLLTRPPRLSVRLCKLPTDLKLNAINTSVAACAPHIHQSLVHDWQPLSMIWHRPHCMPMLQVVGLRWRFSFRCTVSKNSASVK